MHFGFFDYLRLVNMRQEDVSVVCRSPVCLSVMRYYLSQNVRNIPNVLQKHETIWRTTAPDKCNLTLYLASTQENHSLVVCEQQRRRPACESAQSDQRLCYSLNGKYQSCTCIKRSFHFLASLCSCAGWFWYYLVGNPGDRFSRGEVPLCPMLGHSVLKISER